MTKKGFTMVELLVVIVIIAILSALLFPVFAAAKEAAKKTTTASSFRQVGQGMMLYLGDNEDTYPLAWSPDTVAGTWRSYSALGASTLTSAPAGWRGGTFAAEPRVTEDSMLWANSIFPYVKSWKVYEAEGITHFRSGASAVVDAYAANEGKFGSTSLTFNGMLHNYSGSAVASPSQHPMLWQGMFKRSYDGFARTNPELDCVNINVPCRFNSSDYPSPSYGSRTNPGYGYVWFTAINPYGTAWIYGHGMHFIMDDGRARFQPIQAPVMSLNDTGGITRLGSVSTMHPFSRLNSDAGSVPGSPFYSVDCDGKLDGKPPADDGVSLNIAYDCFFRPDSTYEYTQSTASDY